jgi:predicted RNA binding protein YcfA (HicA-like mRNA interferase family)
VPLKPLPYREIKRKLEAVGFTAVTQKGSHVKFVRESEEGRRTTTVPNHKEVAIGTIRSVLRQADLSPEEFEAL